MAIDTAAKRGSSLGVAVVGMAIIWPDGSDLEQPQRMAADGLYLGISDENIIASQGGQTRLQLYLGLSP